MADIFLSYASQDRERIVPLARLLEGCGWSVFWDRKTPIGITWYEYIATNLEVSRCVVVAWSHASVKSKWVRSEARYGLNREACVPLLLERVQPSFPFDQIQAADLSDWRGDAEHRELGDLVAHLRNLLDQVRMNTPSAERNELPVEPAITNADAKIRADQAPLAREQHPSASSSAKPESPLPGKPPATDEGSENLKPGIRAPAVCPAAAVGILAVVWFIAPFIGVPERAAVEVFRDPLKGCGEWLVG